MEKITYYAEYIPYMATYRVYREDKPEKTIAYDDLEKIKKWAEENDFNLIITA